jgi:hypothetical protein
MRGSHASPGVFGVCGNASPYSVYTFLKRRQGKRSLLLSRSSLGSEVKNSFTFCGTRVCARPTPRPSEERSPRDDRARRRRQRAQLATTHRQKGVCVLGCGNYKSLARLLVARTTYTHF